MLWGWRETLWEMVGRCRGGLDVVWHVGHCGACGTLWGMWDVVGACSTLWGRVSHFGWV